jgi:hypothetical protein
MEHRFMAQRLFWRRAHLWVVVSICSSISLLFSGSAVGQEGEEAGFQYGLDSELRYDDNIFWSDNNETDSWILEAVPFVRAVLFNDGNTYQLEYQLNHAEYFDSSEDTYTDHSVIADVNHRFTHRQAVAAQLGYKMLTERRGTGFSEEPNGVVDSPDDYEHINLDFTYYLGVPTAALRFELYAKHNQLDFDSSYVGDSRDYRSNLFGAVSRYRIGARTDLELEYRRLIVSYDNTPLDFNGNPLDLDSDEDYLLAGVSWEMTARTKGEVKIGHSKRDFDNEGFSSSDFHWEANVEWRPKSYSRFILKTARISQETFGSGLYVNSQSYDLSWLHSWSGRLRSEIKVGMIDDTYEDSLRDDDRVYWGAQIGYDYASWLALEAGYDYRENDSTFDLVNYERNLMYIRALVEF